GHHWPRRGRHQGQPAPALSAGHAACEPAGDADAARGCAAGEAGGQHRRVCRGLRVMKPTPTVVASSRSARTARTAKGARAVAPGMLFTAFLAAAALTPPAALANTVVEQASPDGSTPLHWTAYRNDVAAVKQLLQDGADARA